MTHDERASVVAHKVWEWLRSKEVAAKRAAPWASRDPSDAVNDREAGYRRCLADLRVVIDEASEAMKP